MTNPNDLIPRKEVEKMIEDFFYNWESEKDDLLQRLSQIESVNPIVIWFDPAKPWAERTYPLSAIGIDVSK